MARFFCLHHQRALIIRARRMLRRRPTRNNSTLNEGIQCVLSVRFIWSLDLFVRVIITEFVKRSITAFALFHFCFLNRGRRTTSTHTPPAFSRCVPLTLRSRVLKFSLNFCELAHENVKHTVRGHFRLGLRRVPYHVTFLILTWIVVNLIDNVQTVGLSHVRRPRLIRHVNKYRWIN